MTMEILFPARTKHLYNICTKSTQRIRRWSNIAQCFVFAGLRVVQYLIPQSEEIDNQA